MARRSWAPWRGIFRWLLGAAAVAVVVAIVGSFLLDEPLRRRIEGGMNADLKGYRVAIGRVRFHPWNCALELVDWTIAQDANPRPPLGEIPKLTASVQWLALLHGRLVADFRIDRPTLHLDARQGEREVDNPTPAAERGRSWQRAFERIYPLKINQIRVVDGDITYAPGGEFKPLHMTHVDLAAANIRNIRSPDREYPSDLVVDAVVFDRGKLHVDGHADFLAEPYAGLQTDIDLAKLPLAYLTGVLQDYATIRKGTFSARGSLEYAPKMRRVDLREVTIAGADADYVATAANASQSARMRQQTIEAAKNVSNDPGVQLRAEHVRMTDGTIGMVDETADPPYRVFLGDVDLTVRNFSNQAKEGAGIVDIEGKFMGSGPSTLHAVFHPATKSPDFDLAVKIDDTPLRAMNDLLRAKADVDVSAGVFAFYSELDVRNDRVDGYVKPLFRDVKVYDPQQDRDKPVLSQIYQGVVGGVAKLLENPKTEDVATKASVTGPIENPNASTWQILTRLVQNAFFKAILPGLEQSQG